MTPPANALISAECGQVWRDEDGLAWVVVALGPRPEWVYLKRLGYPHSQTIQTLRAWLDKWSLIVNADGSAV